MIPFFYTQGFAQLYLLDDQQNRIKKIKKGSVVSLRIMEPGSFELHGRFIDSIDQVELKGILDEAGTEFIQLNYVSARSYFKKGYLIGSHELQFEGGVAEKALQLKIRPVEVITLTLERDRSRNTALLLRSLGLLTFFAAPLASLNLNGVQAIHSDTYLWVAGSGATIMGIGAIVMHLSKPKTYLLKEVSFPETRKYKRAEISLE